MLHEIINSGTHRHEYGAPMAGSTLGCLAEYWARSRFGGSKAYQNPSSKSESRANAGPYVQNLEVAVYQVICLPKQDKDCPESIPLCGDRHGIPRYLTVTPRCGVVELWIVEWWSVVDLHNKPHPDRQLDLLFPGESCQPWGLRGPHSKLDLIDRSICCLQVAQLSAVGIELEEPTW